MTFDGFRWDSLHSAHPIPETLSPVKGWLLVFVYIMIDVSGGG
jgi:hypothetical protein